MSQLRARSTPDALALWDATMRLAAWRQGAARVAAEAVDRLYDLPHSLSVPVLPSWEEGVGPDDLARAIVALRPDLLRRLAGPGLEAATNRWRGRLDLASLGSLSYSWGRRWAWLQRHPTPIDVDAMMHSLPLRAWWALAQLLPEYTDGLLLPREAFTTVIDSVAWEGRVGPAVPPATLDRVDDRPWRDSLHASSPGLVIRGPVGSGRTTLLHRIIRMYRTRGVGANLDNQHGGGFPNPQYRARPEMVPAAIGPDLICLWDDGGPRDPELVRYAVELALDPDAGFRLVVAADDASWDRLCGWAPDLRRWPTLALSLPQDHEILPLWLCQRPCLEDVMGERVDLDRLLRLRPEDLGPKLIALDLHRRTIADVGEHDRLRGIVPRAFPRARSIRQRVITRPDRTLRTLTRWGLAAHIPTLAYLTDLLALDDAISGNPSRG